jgi:hypothetical protein
MITHRNAYMNVVGTLIHLPMTPADRYLWTLPMFHANGLDVRLDCDRGRRRARLPAKSRSSSGVSTDRRRGHLPRCARRQPC